jgi:hypothetical protein
MSTREVLLVLAHAQWCEPCRRRLLSDPSAVFIGRALTPEEKENLTGLTFDDFYTAERLARAAGCSVEEFEGYRDHPVVRLRHL